MRAGGALGQFFRQFHPLGFAAGEGGGLLAEADVIQARPCSSLHLVADTGHGLKEVDAFFDGHVEDVGDRTCP